MSEQTQAADLSSIRTLAGTALKKWHDSDCEPILIKHRENTVFRVRNAEGNQAVLRVHRPGYHSENALASELAWMAMLAENGFDLPRPIPAKGGQLLVEIEDHLIGPRHVDMLSWMDGEPLGEIGVPLKWPRDRLKAIFFELGRCAARMHRISDAWSIPTGFTRHAWDSDGLLGETPFWGTFWTLKELTPEQRGLLVECRRVATERLEQYRGAGGGYGLIHADLVRENVLVDGDTVRMIDFDDAGFGWRLFEIATILHLNRSETDYALIKDAVLGGYDSVHALSQADIAALPLFLALRSFTYLGWADARRHEAGVEEKIGKKIADAVDCGRSLLQTL